MAAPTLATEGSSASSMTSTSHTLTGFTPAGPSFPYPFPAAKSNAIPKVMEDLLTAFTPGNKHSFLPPSNSIQDGTLESVKTTLDRFAGKLGDEQAERQKEQRRKRKRGAIDVEEEEVLKIRRIHTEGFEVQQVWAQAKKVLDALKADVGRAIQDIGEPEKDEDSEEVSGDGGVELLQFDEDGFEIGSDDDSAEVGDSEGLDEELQSGEEDAENFEGPSDLDRDDYEDEQEIEEESTEVFKEDPHGLNDGFFSIDDFNKQTEFLEQQDATADPYTGEASDEEEIDWDEDPMSKPIKAVSSTRRASAMDIQDEDENDDEEDGPTFGNMDLNAPEGESEDEDSDMEMDEDVDVTGDNTNDILYKDFFEPPPRKAGKGERQAKYLKRQAKKTKAAAVEDAEAGIERAMADVRRDLFDDLSEQEDSQDALSDADPADPKSRRSAHERRQAKLAEEIRRLEAASVAKREWTLSGEARAADRPINSLLEEDLDFERTGKPVPVITAQVSESIEELIKRRILAQEFDEVIRRRPDSLSIPADTRRGAFELDDSKPKQSLAEMYEEEHVKANNPDTYVSKADEKLRKEEKEVELLWKEVSTKLDALSSWHYKPKPPAPSLTVVGDVATISMEDAQPSTASGLNGGESMLAPQEIYKAGKDKENVEKGEVVLKSAVPVARQEMTREEKLRRRRREKERIRKRGGVEAGNKVLGKKAKEKKEVVGELKKGGVRVIGKKGEIRDVDGNKVQTAKALNGAGGFKL